MKLKYAGRCRGCGLLLDAGTEALYVKGEGVYCENCREDRPAPAPASRTFTPPGDDREYERAPGQPLKPETVVRRHLDALWDDLKTFKRGDR